jgi:hypothetical protein
MVFERQAAATSRARSLHYVSRMRKATHVLVVAVLAAALAPVAASAAQGHKENALPPGLAKRESLPPGLAKQLRERGELPPGLQKRLTAVPSPLAARLPRLPGYYDRYFAGDDLLIVDRRTNRLVSLIPNIF